MLRLKIRYGALVHVWKQLAILTMMMVDMLRMAVATAARPMVGMPVLVLAVVSMKMAVVVTEHQVNNTIATLLVLPLFCCCLCSMYVATVPAGAVYVPAPVRVLVSTGASSPASSRLRRCGSASSRGRCSGSAAAAAAVGAAGPS